MADNVTLPATGTGTATPVIASDDIGSGIQAQRIKILDGTDGSATGIPGDGNGLATQGQVAADAVVAGKPVLEGGRASDAIPSAVSADGDAVHAWNDRRGARKVVMVDDSGDSAMDSSLNAVKVAVVTGSVSGTEYSEGSTVISAVGQVPLWEDTSDVFRTISAAKPLPVNIVTGSSAGIQYTEGDTDASITGTVAMWEDTSDTLRAPSVAKPFPVQVVTSPGGSVLPDPIVTSGAVAVPIKFASVNATADGDNTIVTGVPTKKLRVLGYVLMNATSTAGTIQLKSAGATVLGRLRCPSDGAGASYGGGVDAPACETAAGEAFVINNPAGVDTVGHVTYCEI